MNFAAVFDQGLRYEAFLSKYGSDEQRRRWETVYSHVLLSTDQNRLLASFVREMKVLVVAGTWCGDCVNQCPIFQHFAAQNDKSFPISASARSSLGRQTAAATLATSSNCTNRPFGSSFSGFPFTPSPRTQCVVIWNGGWVWSSGPMKSHWIAIHEIGR